MAEGNPGQAAAITQSERAAASTAQRALLLGLSASILRHQVMQGSAETEMLLDSIGEVVIGQSVPLKNLAAAAVEVQAMADRETRITGLISASAKAIEVHGLPR